MVTLLQVELTMRRVTLLCSYPLIVLVWFVATPVLHPYVTPMTHCGYTYHIPYLIELYAIPLSATYPLIIYCSGPGLPHSAQATRIHQGQEQHHCSGGAQLAQGGVVSACHSENTPLQSCLVYGSPASAQIDCYSSWNFLKIHPSIGKSFPLRNFRSR